MFTFHWSELLVTVLGGLGLLIAITILMLRRRNEILQDFLTPEEPELEDTFFHSLATPSDEPEPQELPAEQDQPAMESPADQHVPNPESDGKNA